MEQEQHLLHHIYPPLIVEFMSYVDAHLTSSLSVDELARALHVSSDRLSAEVNHHLQRTIPTYIMRRRVEEAAVMLAQTEESIRGIAEHFQFTRQHYFSTVFRQRFQCSPSAYRQRYWEAQHEENI
ncbi:helix-turn-helix transcriptional regulator [uncultured Marinococcus sp.]|uniref:helix-turn-helix transcriptional regulator n=1 Tax=uncultured Marinococcus sp. TaxID=487012 RepID=UPI0026207F29|nr:AraC family transcriptional regulator [uncultured Marinococcus sp.]